MAILTVSMGRLQLGPPHPHTNSYLRTANNEFLKPNSGQSVAIGKHHVCIGFHEEEGSDYRVWEWHGHLMLFDEENGLSPEYSYGNYFERASSMKPTVEAEEEDQVASLGLRELIQGGESIGGRILHRNMNSGSRRF